MLAVSCDAVAKDKVANVLLASKGRGPAGGPAHTAQDLARSIARELLGPLLDTACSRLASLLRHTFDIAADSQQLLQGTSFVPDLITQCCISNTDYQSSTRLGYEPRG